MIRESLGVPFIEQFGLQEPTIELDDYQILFRFVKDTDYILMGSRMLAQMAATFDMVALPMDFVHQMEWAIISSAKVGVSASAQRVRGLIANIISSHLADEGVAQISRRARTPIDNERWRSPPAIRG